MRFNVIHMLTRLFKTRFASDGKFRPGCRVRISALQGLLRAFRVFCLIRQVSLTIIHEPQDASLVVASFARTIIRDIRIKEFIRFECFAELLTSFRLSSFFLVSCGGSVPWPCGARRV